MDQTDFEDGLDRYGGDLRAWPAGLQAQAEALLASSPAARQAQRAMAAVEQVLTATKPNTTEEPMLAARASRARQERPAARAWLRVGLATGFLSTLLVGVLVGGHLTGAEDTPDHVLQAAFSTAETPNVD